MIRVFVLSMTLALSGAVVPGPLFAMTLYQARLVGWTAGIWLMVGHMLTELVLVALLYAGLGAVLKRPAVMRIIGLIGGVVLLYFAWSMARAALAPGLHAGASGGALTVFGLIGNGVALTLTNPYWYLWWATAGVAIIAAQSARHGRVAWPVFFTGHIFGDNLWYVLVAVLVAVSGRFLDDGAFRMLILICSVGVGALGIGFLVHAFRTHSTPTAE